MITVVMKVIMFGGFLLKKTELNKIKTDQHIKRLLISEEYYEYCLVESYRHLHQYDAYLVGIIGFYVKVIYIGSSAIIASLVFPKAWRMEEIAEWLYESSICIAKQDKEGYFVEHADCILGGVFFKGECIVAYSPGEEKVYGFDDTYVDVSRLYGEETCAVDVLFPEPISSIRISSLEKYEEKSECLMSTTNISKIQIEVQGEAKVIINVN